MNRDKYQIGYGKPPEHSRFKEGESGNSKGRPKGVKNTYTLLNEILNQKITVTENGKQVKISKRAAMLTQLTNKGVKGDTKAIATLFPYMLTTDIKEEEKAKVLESLSHDDREIIELYLSKNGNKKTKRKNKLWHKQ